MKSKEGTSPPLMIFGLTKLILTYHSHTETSLEILSANFDPCWPVSIHSIAKLNPCPRVVSLCSQGFLPVLQSGPFRRRALRRPVRLRSTPARRRGRRAWRGRWCPARSQTPGAGSPRCTRSAQKSPVQANSRLDRTPNFWGVDLCSTLNVTPPKVCPICLWNR